MSATCRWSMLLAALVTAAVVGCGSDELDEPRLLAVEPDGRDALLGTDIVIRAEHLMPAFIVTPAGRTELDAVFDAYLDGPSGVVPLEEVRFVSHEALWARVPAAMQQEPNGVLVALRAGEYRLEVETPQGLLLDLDRAFEIRLPPVLQDVRPSRVATTSGGGRIELRGFNFVPGSRAYVGDREILEPVLVSDERIDGRVPPGEEGAVDIVVISPYGEDRWSEAFTYRPE